MNNKSNNKLITPEKLSNIITKLVKLLDTIEVNFPHSLSSDALYKEMCGITEESSYSGIVNFFSNYKSQLELFGILGSTSQVKSIYYKPKNISVSVYLDRSAMWFYGN